ncbi:hypothetical protein L3i20_v208370 [Paenibacillus sp. L3-i20]|nr:hypothetical protein L3i20_v208370 [Paenibacillus sp. L3-i20]
MSMSKKIAIVTAVTVVSALIVGLLVWKPWISGPKWTEEEVIEAVRAKYSGQITEATLKGASYYIGLKSATGVYELIVDANNGAIHSVTRLSAKGDPVVKPKPKPTATPKPSATPKPTEPNTSAKPGDKETKPPVTKKPTTEKPALLTSAEAGKLASKHVKGVVEKVERGSGDDYLVEVETADGKEFIVQINAISGAIMSVTTDDDDSSDDEDDDT